MTALAVFAATGLRVTFPRLASGRPDERTVPYVAPPGFTDAQIAEISTDVRRPTRQQAACLGTAAQ
jgi:hypothetical protein